jgi:hypothetical protein
LANHKSQGIRFDTMRALMEFFRDEGMAITPGDLFVVTEESA